MARDAAISSLRSGQCDVLVATDVAARGLDLPGVELVIHADLPRSADSYAHRAGRAGRPGCAVRGVSLLLPAPEPTATAVVAGLEREAKVGVRRLTVIGERRRVHGRSAEAAAAATAAAAARSAAFDAAFARGGVHPRRGEGSGDVVDVDAFGGDVPQVTDGGDVVNGVGVNGCGELREEEMESARSRQGERLLVMDRFDMLAGELSDMQTSGGKSGGGGKGGGSKKGNKGKGSRR